MPAGRLCSLALTLVLTTAACARADVSIALPLRGYYHPGRYMPVQVSAPAGFPGSESVLLTARGAMITRLPLQAGASVTVVPWLVFDTRAQALHWSINAGPPREAAPALRPLSVGERLVGYTTDVAAARALFPDEQVIAVALDPGTPLPGAAAAWETLDAIVLDAPAVSRLGERKLEALLGAGVEIAVHAESRPDSALPWRREKDCWILRHTLAGLTAAVYDPEVYAPVQAWQAGWPADFRRTVVLIAFCFAIGTLGVVLWRPAFRVPILLLATLAGLAALRYWARYQIAVQECAGQVMVVDADWAQNDYWAYQTAGSPMRAEVRWVDATTRPIFADAHQLDVFSPLLACYTNGDPRFIQYRIPSNGKIAVLTRTVGPRPQLLPPVDSRTSHLLPMVEKLYLAAGDRVAGEYPSIPMLGSAYIRTEQWQCVLIERKEKTAHEFHTNEEHE